MKIHSKNNSVITTIAISVLILTTIASIGFYISRPQSAATANDAVQQVSLNQAKPVEAQVPQVADKEVLSQTISDVTVEVTSAKIIKTGVEIGVCYTTLDGGEWYSSPGHLFYSTYEIYPDEAGVTTDQRADGKKFGKKCEFIRYRVDDLQSITTPIQFSIIGLTAVPREMYSPCQEFQQRLDTSPNAKAYGLKAKCEESDNGGIAVTLADYDKSVIQDKAKKALDDIAKGVVTGPWEFTITTITR